MSYHVPRGLTRTASVLFYFVLFCFFFFLLFRAPAQIPFGTHGLAKRQQFAFEQLAAEAVDGPSY